MKHSEIVTKAAEAAKTHLSQLAMAGVCVPAMLLYRKGELLISAEGEEVPEGFYDSKKRMPIAVPYSQYWQWIEINSMDLPIL